MKYLCSAFFFLIFLAASSAQQLRNEIGLSAVGNFNPQTVIYLHDYKNEPVISSDKSSLGWGAEYQRWISAHNALGVVFEQNPSDGNLLPTEEDVSPSKGSLFYYIWPQMRYEVAAVATQQVATGKFSPYIQEGVGSIVTNGYGNSGWSFDAALVAGFGAEYATGRNTAVRLGMRMLAARTGCYGDPTCHATWGVAHDLLMGMIYRW